MTARWLIDDELLHDFAAQVGQSGAVVVRGGGTNWDVGGAPHVDAREVCAPSGIVDFRPEELTVCVRAGTTVSELHKLLAEHGQRTILPDGLVEGSAPSGSVASTVGGAIAVGRSAVTRFGDGHVRDSVLQLRYVAANGQLVTAGGPTVKNVSGFDICRLLVGSLGTLGCIGDAVLRTQPIPQHQRWYQLDGLDPRLVLDTVRTASAILWDGYSLWIRLCGYDVDVEDDLARLSAIAGPAVETTPPKLPPFRWSRRPKELFALPAEVEVFVAEIGVGVVHSDRLDPSPAPVAVGVAALNERLRDLFDPDRRFNPGRSLAGVAWF